jgi:hypothetical protein
LSWVATTPTRRQRLRRRSAGRAESAERGGLRRGPTGDDRPQVLGAFAHDAAVIRRRGVSPVQSPEAARRAEAVATARAEAAQAELATLCGELKAEGEARGKAEIAAAELRGAASGKKG